MDKSFLEIWGLLNKKELEYFLSAVDKFTISTLKEESNEALHLLLKIDEELLTISFTKDTGFDKLIFYFEIGLDLSNIANINSEAICFVDAIYFLKKKKSVVYYESTPNEKEYRNKKNYYTTDPSLLNRFLESKNKSKKTTTIAVESKAKEVAKPKDNNEHIIPKKEETSKEFVDQNHAAHESNVFNPIDIVLSFNSQKIEKEISKLKKEVEENLILLSSALKNKEEQSTVSIKEKLSDLSQKLFIYEA